MVLQCRFSRTPSQTTKLISNKLHLVLARLSSLLQFAWLIRLYSSFVREITRASVCFCFCFVFLLIYLCCHRALICFCHFTHARALTASLPAPYPSLCTTSFVTLFALRYKTQQLPLLLPVCVSLVVQLARHSAIN